MNKSNKIKAWRKLAAIVALLFFIAVIYFQKFHRRAEPAQPLKEQAMMHAKRPAAVIAYLAFVGQDSVRMSLDHTYSSEAILKLKSAIIAVANKDISSELLILESMSQQITEDPYSDTHADDIRKAAIVLSNALVDVQQSQFPLLSVEAADVSNSAENIDPKILALNQREVINTFFKNAGRLLEKMTANEAVDPK